MKAEREPFVSGLPGEAPRRAGAQLATNMADEAGVLVLRQIRSRAVADARLLEPLTVARFDGVERIQPDPLDIEAKAAADAVVALVDGILADPLLLLRAAAMLARGKA